MSVSRDDVDELRREGQALRLDDVDSTLKTTAETIGYLIHTARSLGADQAETIDMVETLVRAVDLQREDIREARDVLAKLGYGRDLAVMLTQLARKAKPRPPRSGRNASAEYYILRRRTERGGAAAAR